MIPSVPHEFDPRSLEGEMFDALSKLPDDYYIFHSFKMNYVTGNYLNQHETDFIIFNRTKGIICLEAKATKAKYENGVWYYASGKVMDHNGPFRQAEKNKWALIEYIESKNMKYLLNKCGIWYAVWFPIMKKEDIPNNLPADSSKELILTQEDLMNPEPAINKIYSIEVKKGLITNLTKAESEVLLRNILCPKVEIVPSASFDIDIKNIIFHRLLKEQSSILNFLEEQKTAIINGAAGTGKTLIAVEKAMRHAVVNEKVLFLCYNSQLKNHLEKTYRNDNIDYYTLDGYACKECNTPVADYSKLENKLFDYYIAHNFPYKHIIVDEGQDFGRDSVDEVLELFKSIAEDEKHNGSFYIFYDRLQMVQNERLPSYLSEADCKLTLYRNCRNTESIAKASTSLLKKKTLKYKPSYIVGVNPRLYMYSEEETAILKLDELLLEMKSEGYTDIVILTSKTENNSILTSHIINGKYKNQYRVSTCRKFKGLEADAVVLMDVDKSTFNEDNVLLYYVGTSRAKFKLDIFAKLSEEECKDLLLNSGLFSNMKKAKKPQRDFAKALNAQAEII